MTGADHADDAVESAVGGAVPADGDEGVEAAEDATPAPVRRVARSPLDRSRDDSDVGWGDHRDGGHDDWLLEQRPPHLGQD